MRKHLALFILMASCSAPTSSELSHEERTYFPSGKIREIRFMLHGVKQGLQTGFWENGNKRFEYVAVNDEIEGELKEWTERGQLFHLAHYKNGQEDGVQKMWHANGKIRSNFILIQGRRYGLLGTKNCRNFNEKILVN
jgi:antitoxin component YwqK of YwqJK toxin-antitoxin module